MLEIVGGENIFQGTKKFKELQSINISKLSQEEQNFLDNETEELCQLLDDWQISNIDFDMTQTAWQFMKEKMTLAHAC